MTKDEFKKLCAAKIVILDGATGTELQKHNMPQDVCPEKWVAENPEIIKQIQKKYIEAGSDIIYACTFGCNRLKLAEFGLKNELVELNKKLVAISKSAAAGTNALVAGDLSPTGRFVEPFGDLLFNEAVEIYKEQIRALVDAGADLLVIETMLDIQETRAALIAAKETCDLPVMITLTFAEDGRTLMGADPLTALITLQALGADAFGCNCSTGPDKMLQIIKQLKPYATIPLIAKPNAGLPKLKNGVTYFDMNADEFAKYLNDFFEAGINIIGGCCGTTAEYIARIKQHSKNIKPITSVVNSISALSSARKALILKKQAPITIIGERINPTGKKNLQAELKTNSFTLIRQFAAEQTATGAQILDINVGMGGIDENKKMIEVISFICKNFETPLCIDSSSTEVIENALRLYPGRALINSISGESHKTDKLLDIAAKYGAMFIMLPLTENCLPETADERINIIKSITEKAAAKNFSADDFIVDGLVMTVSSNPNAAIEVIKTIKWCAENLKCHTALGLSNISFGMPERSFINSAFLAMAAANGLTMTIANPGDTQFMNIKFAVDVLKNADKNSQRYISRFTQTTDTNASSSIKKNNAITDPATELYDAVLNGDSDNIIKLINQNIDKGTNPNDLINKILIPAITKVGELYEKKEYFLPQLIAGAEAMKTGFNFLEPLIEKEAGVAAKKAVVIMATVEGDIHDIGKNIVSVMLKNYGYAVIDLGKNITADEIISAVIKHNADFIGLSALMTTTMTQMKKVVELAKNKNLHSKIMVGGAVITQEYCDEIGADGYACDALAAVKLLNKLK